MKTFLCSIALMLVASSLAIAEDAASLKKQLNEILKNIERNAGKEPVQPTIEVKKDEVVITSNDIDQVKDAIFDRKPEDRKKPVRVIVPKVKAVVEDGEFVIYSSFDKRLGKQLQSALVILSSHSTDLYDALREKPTDVRYHMDVAERVLELEAHVPGYPQRSLRLAWAASLSKLGPDVHIEFLDK